jgi:uncharacterized membrane protein
LALGLALALAAAACGADVDDVCATSDLTYETFGGPFVTTWCRGCHSRDQPMRQRAPVDINFDTRADVERFAQDIQRVAGTGRTMPPAGGPSDAERALLVEWVSCDTP